MGTIRMSYKLSQVIVVFIFYYFVHKFQNTQGFTAPHIILCLPSFFPSVLV